ncbi:MAG: hypothetical protein AB8E15_08050 [Bdellovibrionales bacterium]
MKRILSILALTGSMVFFQNCDLVELEKLANTSFERNIQCEKDLLQTDLAENINSNLIVSLLSDVSYTEFLLITDTLGLEHSITGTMFANQMSKSNNHFVLNPRQNESIQSLCILEGLDQYVAYAEIDGIIYSLPAPITPDWPQPLEPIEPVRPMPHPVEPIGANK